MITAEMPAKNDDRINIRLPSDLLETLEEIQRKHALGTPEIARRCLEAVAAFYREHGFFSFPVRLEPESGFIERTIQYGTTTAIEGAKNDAKAHQQTSANSTETAGEKARARATGRKVG